MVRSPVSCFNRVTLMMTIQRLFWCAHSRGRALRGGAGRAWLLAPRQQFDSPAKHDYPTVARVEYVNECIGQNGGKLEALYQCSCAIDRIAAPLSYDEFVEAGPTRNIRHCPAKAAGFSATPTRLSRWRSAIGSWSVKRAAAADWRTEWTREPRVTRLGLARVTLNVPRYSNIAIVLHWVIAALVVTLVVLGFYMTGLPRNTADRAYFVNLHKSLGVLTLVLVVVRAGWRLSHKPPPLPASTPAWQQRGAALSHGLLYAAMLLQPVTGYLMSSFGKFGVRFFGVPLPVACWPDPLLRGWFANAHRAIAFVLISLVAIHVMAAAGHGLLARDGVLQRMLPRRSR